MSVENKKDSLANRQFCLLDKLNQDSLEHLNKRFKDGFSFIPEAFYYPTATTEQVTALVNMLGTYISETMLRSEKKTKVNNAVTVINALSGGNYVCFSCPSYQQKEYRDVLGQSIKKANSVLSVLAPDKQFPDFDL